MTKAHRCEQLAQGCYAALSCWKVNPRPTERKSSALLSIQTGELPSIWKHACITAVFKKGSPSNPSNYRPISLTCIACKLIEIGIKEALINHLLQHKLISHHQHGFLSRKSTCTQLLECCANWNVAINTHNNIDVVYLDFARAFDSVVHSKLIMALILFYYLGFVVSSPTVFSSSKLTNHIHASCLS